MIESRRTELGEDEQYAPRPKGIRESESKKRQDQEQKLSRAFVGETSAAFQRTETSVWRRRIIYSRAFKPTVTPRLIVPYPVYPSSSTHTRPDLKLGPQRPTVDSALDMDSPWCQSVLSNALLVLFNIIMTSPTRKECVHTRHYPMPATARPGMGDGPTPPQPVLRLQRPF